MIKKTLARLLLVIGLIIFSSHAFAVKCTEEQIRNGDVEDCEYDGNLPLVSEAENFTAENGFKVTGNLNATLENNTTVVLRPTMDRGARMAVTLTNRGESGREVHIQTNEAGFLTVYGLGPGVRYQFANFTLGNRNNGTMDRAQIADLTLEHVYVTVRSNVHNLAIDNLRIIESDSEQQHFTILAGRFLGIGHITIRRLDRYTLFQVLAGLATFVQQGQGNVINQIEMVINADELEPLITFLNQNRGLITNTRINIRVNGIQANRYYLRRMNIYALADFLVNSPKVNFYVNNDNTLLQFAAWMPLILNNNDVPCLANDSVAMARIHKYILQFTIRSFDTRNTNCSAYIGGIIGEEVYTDTSVNSWRRYGRNAYDIKIYGAPRGRRQDPEPAVMIRGVNRLRNLTVNAQNNPVYIGPTTYNGPPTMLAGVNRFDGARGGYANIAGDGDGGVRPVLALNDSTAMTIRNNPESNPVQVSYNNSSRNIQEQPPGSKLPGGGNVDLSSCLRCMIINNITSEDNRLKN